MAYQYSVEEFRQRRRVHPHVPGRDLSRPRLFALELVVQFLRRAEVCAVAPIDACSKVDLLWVA